MANRRLKLLLVMAVLLAGLFYWDSTQEQETVTAISRSTPPGPGQASENPEDVAAPLQTGGNPLAKLRLRELPATRERPLFTPSRTAPTPPPAAASEQRETPDAPAEAPPAPSPEPGPFVLMGVVRATDEGIALLKHKATGELLRLRIGDVFDGWRLESVESDRVLLRKGETAEELVLFEEEGAG